MKKKVSLGIIDVSFNILTFRKYDMGIRTGADRQREIPVAELPAATAVTDIKQSAHMGSSHRMKNTGMCMSGATRSDNLTSL